MTIPKAQLFSITDCEENKIKEDFDDFIAIFTRNFKVKRSGISVSSGCYAAFWSYALAGQKIFYFSPGPCYLSSVINVVKDLNDLLENINIDILESRECFMRSRTYFGKEGDKIIVENYEEGDIPLVIPLFKISITNSIHSLLGIYRNRVLIWLISLILRVLAVGESFVDLSDKDVNAIDLNSVIDLNNKFGIRNRDLSYRSICEFRLTPKLIKRLDSLHKIDFNDLVYPTQTTLWRQIRDFNINDNY